MQQTSRNALPIVAAALGRKLGVAVGVGGHEGCTDGQRSQIPAVAAGPASRDLAWGYLAHEAAHVRWTDFAVYEQAAREGPLQEMLRTASRTCASSTRSRALTAGTRATIAKVLQQMLAEGRLSAPAPSDHLAQVLIGHLLIHQARAHDPAQRRAANALLKRTTQELAARGEYDHRTGRSVRPLSTSEEIQPCRRLCA